MGLGPLVKFNQSVKDKLKMDNELLVIAISGVSILVVGISYFYYRKSIITSTKHQKDGEYSKVEDNTGNPSNLRRSMSFNSKCLIDGVFPKHVNESPSIINVCLFFNEIASPEKVAEKFQILLNYDRFRMTPKKSGNQWYFENVGNTDILNDHISTVEVSSEAELTLKLESITSSDLPGDGKIPLWQVYRLVNNGPGISVLLVRMHHVISDGIGLLGVMSKMFTDKATNEPLVIDIPEKMRSGHKQDAVSFSVFSSIYLACKTVYSVFAVLSLAASNYDSNILFTSPNKRNLVMSSRKNIFFPTVKLDFIKEIKTKANVSVNDVIFTAMSGAIMKYCKSKNDPLFSNSNVKERQIVNRALIPLAFPRSKAEMDSYDKALKNKWAFISVQMPLSEPTAKQRLMSCNKTTNELKTSPMPLVQYWIQNYVIPHLPSFIGKQASIDLFSRHSIVFSNLPGFENLITFGEDENIKDETQSPFTVLGCQIIFNNILPQVILISYHGAVFCCMNLDSDLFVDGDTLLPKFYLEELKDLASEFGIDVSKESSILTRESGGGIFSICDI